jgi:integrase
VRLKLHANTFHQLQALNGRRTEYTDTVVPGLQLRVSPTGARAFYVRYSRFARVRRYWLGATPPLGLAAARTEARRILSAVGLGRDPLDERRQERRRAAEAERLSFSGLADKYMAQAKLRPDTRRDWEGIIDRVLKPALGTRPAAGIVRADVRELLDPIIERAPVRANRVLAVIRRIYTWAMDKELVQASPCTGLKPPTDERVRRRKRVLSDEELLALLVALERLQKAWPLQADATELLLFTCLRESAVLGLHDDDLVDVTGEAPLAVIPPERRGTKAKIGRGVSHLVPLSAAAVVVAQRRLASTSGALLFPGKPRRKDAAPAPWAWTSDWTQLLRYQLAVALLEARGEPLPLMPKKRPDDEDVIDVVATRKKVPHWSPHTLRHTITTVMIDRLRVAKEVTGRILGHTQRADPKIAEATDIYDHAELLDERRAAFVSWAAYLTRLKTDGYTAKVLPIRGRGGRA